ncbi:hypothetical protein HOY82DRAFT_554152 [Tuber indicum]|nr:hypothetical protein HOY82DRAFT_554152 [Tuber indicum]
MKWLLLFFSLFLFYLAGTVIRFRPFICRIDARGRKIFFSPHHSLEHCLLSVLFPAALLPGAPKASNWRLASQFALP